MDNINYKFVSLSYAGLTENLPNKSSPFEKDRQLIIHEDKFYSKKTILSTIERHKTDKLIKTSAPTVIERTKRLADAPT